MTNEFFTWAVLLTYAGATLATSLVTQLIKGVGFIDKIPTRLTSYVIALVVLIAPRGGATAATFFTGGLTLEAGALCVINAVVVSLAANGAYDAIARDRK